MRRSAADLAGVERGPGHGQAARERLGLPAGPRDGGRLRRFARRAPAQRRGARAGGAVAGAGSDRTLFHVCGPRDHDEVRRPPDAAGLPARRRRVSATGSSPSRRHGRVVGGGRPRRLSRRGDHGRRTDSSRPSILVPLPGAPGDHQGRNAEVLARAGAARVIDDAACDAPTLAAVIDELSRVDVLAAMARAADVARPPRRGVGDRRGRRGRGAVSLLDARPARPRDVVGVAASGMSGLALWLTERGAVVSGRDATSSAVLDELTVLVTFPPQLVTIRRTWRTWRASSRGRRRSPPITPNSPPPAARGLELVSRARALAEIPALSRRVGRRRHPRQDDGDLDAGPDQPGAGRTRRGSWSGPRCSASGPTGATGTTGTARRSRSTRATARCAGALRPALAA